MHWDATTLRLLGAEWGRVGRAGRVGLGRGWGMHWDAIKQLKPSGAECGRVGPEWGRVGLGGVGEGSALPAHLNSERVHKQPRC